MIELGELERHHVAFGRRQARVLAASVDGLDDTRKMQEAFPHLTLLSDPDLSLVKALTAVHAGAGPEGHDIAAPTTLLVGREGQIVWTFRSSRVVERLSTDELLAAIDRHLR